MKQRTGMQSWVKHLASLASAACIFLCGNASAQLGALLPLPGLPGPAPVAPVGLDPLLQSVMQSAGSAQPIEAVVTFNRFPTPADLLAIQALGVELRTFSALPMAAVRGTSAQFAGLLSLPGLRSVYFNRQLAYFLDESVPLVGADRVWNELGVTGAGVTVAVIDTGIDATHPDLPFGTKVVQNVKVAPDLFGTGPLILENLADADTTSGHGTHVSSIVGGTGAALAGRYRGVATGSWLVGVGAGEVLVILSALEAFDWVLQNRERYGIRVVSNSWGTSGAFSPDDPINVASRLAYEAGLAVVFAAGNAGSGENTLNPYCVAQWVICVAAGDKSGALADFSSRGIPGDPDYHPTITAPGVGIAAARAKTGVVMNTFFAVDVVNLGADAVWYTSASGTSMATPHVSGTIALMLEANPWLTPDDIKFVLEFTATPMFGYQQYEVGAGYLNAYDAVNLVR